MSDGATNSDSSNRLVDLYVASVAAVALALTGWVFYLQRDNIVPPSKGIYVAIFCVLLFIGETRTKWFRFGDGGEVTPGWAFAFSIVLLGSPVIAIAADGGMHALRRSARPQGADQDRVQRRPDHGLTGRWRA